MERGAAKGSRVGASGFESLAQLVEHWTFNPGVEGSSPSWLTLEYSIVEMRHANGDRSSILLFPILGESQQLVVLMRYIP